MMDKKLFDNTCSRLWTLQGALKGLGALFQCQKVEFYLNEEELFGLGQLLKSFSKELENIEQEFNEIRKTV